MTGVSYRGVLAGTEPHKSLTRGAQRARGRNNRGVITTRHKGGGAKRRWREVDFRYDKRDIPARVATVEYDPNRSGFIALLHYADGEKRYVLAPSKTTVGDAVLVSETAPLGVGNRLPLSKIPVGTFVYNIELNPGAGARLVRSAGNYAEVIAHDAGKALIRLPSSEVRRVSASAWASIGAVSNEEHHLVRIGKAGRSRAMGVRPTVRGSAMNPVDHPFGGGEGRGGAGMRRPKNKWGGGIRGRKTRRVRRYSNVFIVERRRKKR